MNSPKNQHVPDAQLQALSTRLSRATRRRLRRSGVTWLDGEDVVQEAWVRVLSRERDTGGFSPGILAVVAHRIAIDAARRQPVGDDDPRDVVAGVASTSSTELAAELRAHLARLNVKQRSTIFLRLWLEASWDLCALVLDYRSRHAAECAYARAMSRLRRSWSKQKSSAPGWPGRARGP